MNWQVSPKFYSKSYTSEHAYINGKPVKDVELAKTQHNQWIQVKGHINDRPVFYQNFAPSLLTRDGMTASKSRRKRGKRHKRRSKTEKKPKLDTSLEKRK